MNSNSEAIRLPSDKKKLASVLSRHADRERARCLPMYTMWKLASLYLQGYRNFKVFNPAGGAIKAYMTDEDGKLGFQMSKLLADINEVADLIGEMDVRPKVARNDDSLDGIRDRSIAQIVANAITDESSLNEAKSQFTFMLTMLGSCGLTGDVSKSAHIGLTASYMPIHPRELYPFPSLGDDCSLEQGIMRERMIPLEYLRDTLGNSVVSDAWLDKMEWWETPAGEALGDPHRMDDGNDQIPLTGLHSPNNQRDGHSGARAPKRGEETIGVVRVKELWLHGDRSTTRRYVSSSGMQLFEDMDYAGREVPRTIGFSRFLNNSNWHGAGLFHLMFSMHRELEKLMRDLFTNIGSIDRYGVVVMPAGQYNERNLLKNVGHGLRMLNFTPESSFGGDSFKPFAIAPQSSGEIPGKAALLTQSMMQQLNPVTDLINSKGRVDGGPGLQMLEEEGRRKLNRVLSNVGSTFATVHKSNVATAVSRSTLEAAPFPVGRLSIDMAGTIVDFDRETVTFNDNTLPRVHRMTFTVKDMVPKNREARKQNAIGLATGVFSSNGIPDSDGLKLYLIREGYDVEFDLTEEQSSYEMIVRQILKLYGNGEENVMIEVSPHTTRPALQLRVLAAFMGGVVFDRASVKIKNDFIQFKEQLEMFINGVLPAPMKNPDDYVYQNALSLAQGGTDPMNGQPMAQNLSLPRMTGA